MASSENPATPPAENNAEPIANAPIAEVSEQSPTVPTTTPPVRPKERLADSSFEASLVDLPPLSTIPSGNETAAETKGKPESTENSPSSRRGLGRGSNGRSGSGSSAKPSIGVVEDTSAINENLSGQYAGGYGEQQQQPRRPARSYEERPASFERREPSEPRTPVERREPVEPRAPLEPRAPAPKAETTADNGGPREFVPPVSKGTFKAEMNPERERQAREDQRRERQSGDRQTGGRQAGGRYDGDNRGGRSERPARGGERREFFGERSEDQSQEWAPSNRNESRGESRSESRDAAPPQKRDGARQKLVIEPAKIPVQPEETFFGKIKRFFSTLFGVSEPEAKEAPGKGGNQREGREHGDRNGRRGGRDRSRDRQRGDFRHGNRSGSGTPQSYNRDGRHRPHSRGGNKPNRGE